MTPQFQGGHRHSRNTRLGCTEQQESFGQKPISLILPTSSPFPWALLTDDKITLKGVSGENTPAQQISTHRAAARQHTQCSCPAADLAKQKNTLLVSQTFNQELLEGRTMAKAECLG